MVRPDFWQDDTIGHLPDQVRLFYVGLWCVADDAGWLEWRVAQLGASLYPYRPASNRERNIRQWADQLVAAGRVVIHPCGCAYMPTFAGHQRSGGNPSYQYRDKHRRHGDSRTNTDEYVPVRTSMLEMRGDETRGDENNPARARGRARDPGDGDGDHWQAKVQATIERERGR